MKKIYLIRHKKIGDYEKKDVYLRIFDSYKHYTMYKEEATRFSYQKAYVMKNKFNHPENWEVIKEE